MSNDAFVPEDYSAPAGNGKYTKFQAGETRLRILSNPMFGFEYWNTQGKPVRLREQPKTRPADMRQNDSQGREEKIKHFWAMKVYNYTSGQMELCQITQATLQARLTELSRDKDWGHPKAYDIKVNKSGSGKDTEYSIVAVPHQPANDVVRAAYAATPIDLEALFIPGADPFSNTSPSAVGAPAPATAAAPANAPAPVAPPVQAAQSVPAGRVEEIADLPF